MLEAWWLVGDSYERSRFACATEGDAPGEAETRRRRASRRALRLHLAELAECVRRHGALAGRQEFDELLISIHKPAGHDSEPNIFHAFKGLVLGLIVVRRGFVLQSCLTKLTPQQRSVYVFWNLLTRQETGHRLCFFELFEIIPLLHAQPVIIQGSTQVRAKFFSQVTDLSSHRMLGELGLCGRLTVADVLANMHQDQNISVAMPTDAVHVYAAHALLMCFSPLWSSYAFPLFQYNRRGTGSDLAKHILSQVPQQHEEEDQHYDELTGAVCQEIADSLRSWAPHLLEQHDTENLRRHVQILQRHADMLLYPGGEMRHRQWAYPMICLINSIFMISTMRSQSGHSLKQACLQACKVLFSNDWASIWAEHFGNKELCVPTSTTLSRHKLTLHAGLMLFLRQINTAMADVTRYVTLDSSPQGGRDWLNTASLTMTKVDIAKTFRIMLELIPLAREASEGTIDREAELVQELTTMIRIRRGVPVCLGSGRTSVHHKMHATAHALRLEHVEWSGVATSLNTTLAFTTDFGVEYLLSSLPKFDLKTLFPWGFEAAQAPMAFAPEGEEGGPVPMIFEPEGVNGDGPLPAAPTEDSISTYLKFHLARIIVKAPLVDRNVCFDKSTSTDGNPDIGPFYEVDMSSSLGITGLLHIIHNAVNDLRVAMSYWETYTRGLTRVAKLLSKDFMLRRFLQTCCSSGAGLHHRLLLERWDGCTVHAGRWGTIAHASQALRDPVESALRNTWSIVRFSFGRLKHADNFNEGDDDGPDDREGSDKLLGFLDGVITSPLFWAYRALLDNLFVVITMLMLWCESCPCHFGQQEMQGDTKYHRRNHFRQNLGIAESCPLRTRRAPEMSAGELQNVLTSLFEARAASNPNVLIDAFQICNTRALINVYSQRCVCMVCFGGWCESV